MSADRIFITGAKGFIGRALVAEARARHLPMATVSRTTAQSDDLITHYQLTRDLTDFDWKACLQKNDVVVHLAGLAHQNLPEETAMAQFRKVNTYGALALADAAAAAGARRFVFLSSIGVNGNTSRRPFCETDTPAPINPYAIAKKEAEDGLLEPGRFGNMQITILRPPLVYGPDAPGNFGTLLKAARRGLPLPFTFNKNRRSFIGLDNLVDAILWCSAVDQTPQAAGQTYLLAENEVLSSMEFFRHVYRVFGHEHRLWPCPPAISKQLLTLLGRGSLVESIFGSLEIDTAHMRENLKWAPPHSMQEQFEKISQSQ